MTGLLLKITLGLKSTSMDLIIKSFKEKKLKESKLKKISKLQEYLGSKILI